jgi:hypothetical protein
MHIKKDDIPLVAFPHDELWVKFQDQPIDSVLWLSAVSGTATVILESGDTEDPALMTSFGAPINLTFKNARSLTDLVGIGMPLTDQFLRIRLTAGRIEASIAGPMPFRHYLRSLIT